MKIFLIGYMGSGKTTIGRPLAQALGMSFVDMDSHIVDKYHRSVAEIFEKCGEEEFRKIENQILQELTKIDNAVISTGGGTPCFFDNMEIMNSSGITVYLKVSPKGLAQRLKNGRGKRPLLRDKSDEELLKFIDNGLLKRDQFYSSAKMIVGCDGYSDVRLVEIIALAIKENLA